MKKYLYSLITILFFTISCWSSVPFTVGEEGKEISQLNFFSHAYNEYTRRFFIGSHQEIEKEEEKSFAVSCLALGDKIIGIAPEKVMLNGEKDQNNPLYGAKISQLSLLDRRPVIVPDKDPSSLYIIEGFEKSDDISMTGVNSINDAEGNVSSGIVALTSNASGHISFLPPSRYVFVSEDREGSLIYAAVKNSDGRFGQKGSGIALISSHYREIKNKNKKIKEEVEKDDSDQSDVDEEGEKKKKIVRYERVVQVSNACDGNKIKEEELLEDDNTSDEKDSSEDKKSESKDSVERVIESGVKIEKEGNKAAPLDGETEAVFINNPAELFDAVTLFNEFRLGLYVGLQGKAGSEINDGMRSLILGKLNGNGKLEFSEIAPSKAFTSDDKIIGAVGANSPVSVHHISSMLTSTWLDYLVVVGGNGIAEQTQDQVYALPMVGFLNEKQNGVIAKKDSIPSIFSRSNGKFLQRSFIDPAEKPEDMPLKTDDAARVGGGSLGLKITKIFTTMDTVFVSASQADNGLQPGIFYSQALFDDRGRIVQWTPWARAGAVGNIYGFAFDALAANFIFMHGINENFVNNIERTSFGKLSFSDYIEEEFSQLSGGVQGIDEFSFDSLGFSAIAGKRLSVISWTGNKKITLSQVGSDDENGNFGPSKMRKAFRSDNGSLSKFTPDDNVSNIVMSGGDLDKLGSIVSTALLTYQNNGYFVVGGFGGIAVLADKHGNGFDVRDGLQSKFVGFDESLFFKKLSFSGRVRKLISNGEYLYIVTDKKIMRAQFTPSEIEKGNVAMVCLADNVILPDFGSNNVISDAVISNGFAVIATSAGVYFASNLDKVFYQSDINWQRLDLFDEFCSSARLLALGPKSGFDNNGMVLVLNSHVGFEQSRIFRLAVDSSNKSNPVKKIPDISLLNRPSSYFVNVGAYRSCFVTDGAATFVMRSKTKKSKVLFEHYSPVLRSGISPGERRRDQINIDIEEAESIGPVIRSTTSGEWLIVGDFGVRGNG